MRYSLHPNVSIEEICGTYLLIASGDACKKFEYVRTLNEVGGKILSMVQEGRDTEEIVTLVANEYDKKAEEITYGIYRFLLDMESRGYLLSGEENK